MTGRVLQFKPKPEPQPYKWVKVVSPETAVKVFSSLNQPKGASNENVLWAYPDGDSPYSLDCVIVDLGEKPYVVAEVGKAVGFRPEAVAEATLKDPETSTYLSYVRKDDGWGLLLVWNDGQDDDSHACGPLFLAWDSAA